MQEENVVDADFEEINDTAQNEASTDPVKLSKYEIMTTLRNAVEIGQIDRKRAKQIREEMGIFQSDFTRKKVAPEKRKEKRKARKVARKRQRK